MKSKILLEEIVNNKDRQFGAADEYYPCKLINEDGVETDALFTFDQLAVAVRRANKNPEDMPEDPTFWGKIFG